ncbi:type II toxin-antitoxin system YafQ family toxin [Schleiferilactobacillus shenzhenensis]|uniref:type II toxin-antitoxin system YafQ family toxin n=1 Tax=Schleiferilactobacillus shenzhenensis TaxID=1231337 RepID=UPI0009DCB613|nr:type II toxin-antitoxin system YafQ family toxin [Schleiferilactobacillus shenzhenensis]
MYELDPTPTFRRDVKKLQKKHYSLEKLERVVDLLAAGGNEKELAVRYSDHPLSSDSSWKEHRELHVDGPSGDWLLIYRILQNLLSLVRTGSHKALLGK